jgi:hypothetical protein
MRWISAGSLDAGVEPGEALVRARVIYFHQVGYYALEMGETRRERLDLSRTYYYVLTGFPEFAPR